MTEIEQLRQDIEQAKEIMFRFYKQDRQALGIGEMYDRLAKLEAEAADPWQEHKEVLSGRFHTQQGADHDEKLVLNYAMHLQQTNEKLALKARLDAARIAELEAELARTKEAHETVGEAYNCKREDNKDLRRTVKELEAELAKRPVVWCVRHKGNILKQSASPNGGVWDRYHFAGLFPTRLDAAKLMRGEPEPYTGEQS